MTRRWDQQITPAPDDPANIHPSFISALTSLSTSLSYLASTIPPHTPLEDISINNPKPHDPYFPPRSLLWLVEIYIDRRSIIPARDQ